MTSLFSVTRVSRSARPRPASVTDRFCERADLASALMVAVNEPLSSMPSAQCAEACKVNVTT
jgi:hypothetical protein